jgi:hypothetical protein
MRTHPACEAPTCTCVSGEITPTTCASRLASVRTLTQVWTVLSTHSAVESGEAVVGRVAALALGIDVTCASVAMGSAGFAAGAAFGVTVESRARAAGAIDARAAARERGDASGLVDARPRNIHPPKAVPVTTTIVRPVHTNGLGRGPRAVGPHHRHAPRRRG